MSIFEKKNVSLFTTFMITDWMEILTNTEHFLFYLNNLIKFYACLCLSIQMKWWKNKQCHFFGFFLFFINDYLMTIRHIVTESNHFISSWAMHCLSANLLRHAKWTTLTIVLLLLAQFQFSSLLSQTLSLYLSNCCTMLSFAA